MIPQTYELGQEVTFSHALSRSTTPVGTREWHSHPYEADAAREQQGIIVGKRRLANGAVRWEEWGAEFDASEYFTAYLIAHDLHRKPVHVLPEHITATLPEGANAATKTPPHEPTGRPMPRIPRDACQTTA